MKTPSDALPAPNERHTQRADVRGVAFLPKGAQFVLACTVLTASCNLDNPGYDPPEGLISYPMGIAISREPKPGYLFVANSNFDLRYNAGSIHTYDLNALDRLLDEGACRALEDKGVVLDGAVVTVPDETRYGSMDGGAPDAGGGGTITLPPDYNATSAYGNARGVLCDGRAPDPAFARCCINATDDGPKLPPASLPIDSFANGLAVSLDGRRLYAPVSSRSVLLDIDINPDGTLSCGGASGARCERGPGYQRPDDDPKQEFTGSPAALAVGKLGDLGVGTDPPLDDGKSAQTNFVAMAHDRGGMGLYVENSAGRLVLESALSEVIPPGNLDVTRPTAIATSTGKQLLYVTSMYQPSIWRFGVRVDRDSVEGENGPRELLYQTSPLIVPGLAEATDPRDLVFDPASPNRFYALLRGVQESVAILEHDPADPSVLRLVDVIRVGGGPSKLALIETGGRTYLMVSCYDARSLFIIDTAERTLVAIVRNLSGPYQMSFDMARNLVYVADFRASVVRVVDVRWLADKSNPPPRIIATIGAPRFEGDPE